MAIRKRVNFNAGGRSGGGEVLEYTIYDTQKMLSTISEHRYFQNGVGKPMSDTTIKTFADTNIETALVVPQNQKFVIHAIKVALAPSAVLTAAKVQKLLKMLTESVLNVHVVGKDSQLRMKLSELLGINLAMSVDDAAANVLTPMLQVKTIAAYKLNVPIVVAAQDPFEIILNHYAASNDADLDACKITFSLQGVLRRLGA